MATCSSRIDDFSRSRSGEKRKGWEIVPSENFRNFEPMGGYDPPSYGLRTRPDTVERFHIRVLTSA